MYFDARTLGRIITVANDPRRFNLKRALVMDTLVSVFTSVHAVNFIGEKLDPIRHPECEDMDVGAPIYIVAAPRSGTTFLHRLMSLDPAFTTFTLYQTIFPSITASELADRVMSSGGLVARLVRAFESSVDQNFDGWEGVHDTGLASDEEDEALWALGMATPAVLLLLPFPEKFQHLRYADRLPEEMKRGLVANYERALKARRFRHPGKTLLMKNVLLPSRYELVMRAAPKSRFVHIVRHPYEVVASSLSLFTLPWTQLAPELYGPTETTRDFADLMIEYYRFFYDREREAEAKGDPSMISMRYTDLVTNPLGEVARVYERFGLPLTADVERRFRAELAEQSDFKSVHDYSLAQFGLTEAYVASKLGDVMDHYGFER